MTYLRYAQPILGTILLLLSIASPAQRLTTWTEAPGELGLGYPVPIPQNTPLPFDGFRSYAALHARHLSLADTHAFIHHKVIGSTHEGQSINLYILSDPDAETTDLRAEGSVLFNGGIHAREWQSPEVVTGVMELLADKSDDDHLYQYLIENMNIALIPVLNIDGFLQTQRFPTQNFLDSDINFPEITPRDGRMRRKNMRNTDTVLSTTSDHLLGIDLNRNNPPFHASSNRSSNNPASLVYHGTSAFSEPETQALANAPNQLIPGSDQSLGKQLRLFIDLHSYTRVLFPIRTFNTNRTINQAAVMQTLVNHHAAIPGGRIYSIQSLPPANSGIGVTPEYFATQFEVPAWTLELEPGIGAGAEYGGFASNSHDGFILPDSEIRRLRENMAASLAASVYHMAGPPAIIRTRILATDTGTLLGNRALQLSGSAIPDVTQTVATLLPDTPYQLDIDFNKPMRWIDSSGNIAPFPGQQSTDEDIRLTLRSGSRIFQIDVIDVNWPLSEAEFDSGYRAYQSDKARVLFSIPLDGSNAELLTFSEPLSLAIETRDMVGFQLDSDATTPVVWQAGDWINYERSSNSSFADTATTIDIFQEGPPIETYQISPEVAGLWSSAERNGEGLIIEVLDNDRALVSWAIYDENGNQRWLIGVGIVVGNRIIADSMTLATGAIFGNAFDPSQVQLVNNIGAMEMVFTACDRAYLNFDAFNQSGVVGSTSSMLSPVSEVLGLECNADNSQQPQFAHLSGSWFDPSHNGEGMNIHLISEDRAVMYWYTYDDQGNQYWIVGTGDVTVTGELIFEQLFSTRGTGFGFDFQATDVELIQWGSADINLSCDTGTLDYRSELNAFGEGRLDLVRITSLGLPCPSD